MLGASADHASAEKSRFCADDTRAAGYDLRLEGSNNPITARTCSQVTE